MFSIRLLSSDSYDPWFNLAAENYIFYNMIKNQCILFLWQNYDTVVIGRAQNPWKECNTKQMEHDNVRLARRSSGGGAVFHDLGNTCFTFMSRETKLDYDSHFSTNIVLDGLKRLGINAFTYGRNDIMIETDLGKRKISGSAYRKTNFGKFHHGTLLLNTNLNKLVQYLTPDEKKIKSKGISSIYSRVTNLAEIQPSINHEILCQSLKESFFSFFNKEVELEIVSPKNFSGNFDFLKLFIRQSSWKWNFGFSPDFTHELNTRFEWGEVSFYFDVKCGIITYSYVFTDSLYPEPLEDLAYKLINISYNFHNIQFCCRQWLKQWSNYPELLEISVWLEQSVS